MSLFCLPCLSTSIWNEPFASPPKSAPPAYDTPYVQPPKAYNARRRHLSLQLGQMSLPCPVALTRKRRTMIASCAAQLWTSRSLPRSQRKACMCQANGPEFTDLDQQLEKCSEGFVSKGRRKGKDGDAEEKVTGCYQREVIETRRLRLGDFSVRERE